jgi:site-specific DNA-methyltransferase (adenine-specific)
MQYQIHHGDNREVLKNLADNSIDSVVTDPPYELGFMGKSWDATGVAYSVELWQEVMRVLKPGGHLLAFSGSRTYHRMAVAIEDAGFEIRDQIMWIYGSGFPKSHNIAKGIDKASGFEGEVVGKGTSWNRPDSEEGDVARMNASPGEYDIIELSAEAKQWQGWGTALKPAHEPIVVARKPLIGTVAANVLTYGTGGLNIDGARVGTTVETWPATRNYSSKEMSRPGSTLADDAQTQSTGEAPAGRWPANVIHDGSDEVMALFPDTKSPKTYLRSSKATANIDWNPKEADTEQLGFGDSGSAARFFYCAKASKRDRNEGLDGFEAKFAPTMSNGIGGKEHDPETATKKLNHHPTVKPTDLMRYLCRLVTPPGGIVLDPFMGSGSTGKAAMYEGFEFVGIELTDEYLPIAKARIEFAIEEMKARLL